ncbi:hypothetical protein SBA2_450044 [Acidobacteriia bacterium SbA2]|nr:hypothetical protein SBA2_450044 [Acidobacteriia bacterium SbA2]
MSWRLRGRVIAFVAPHWLPRNSVFSRVKFWQMIGRGTRLCRDPRTQEQDPADSYARDVSKIGYWGGQWVPFSGRNGSHILGLL